VIAQVSVVERQDVCVLTLARGANAIDMLFVASGAHISRGRRRLLLFRGQEGA
jgi:hypothetical protein